MEPVRVQIAVLDDEEAVRRALERLLRSVGMAVAVFGTGSAFLESLVNHVFNCVILDLHMPGLNGFDVQSRLQAMAPRPPVVVITGHDTPEARARAMAGGASAYLLKPVDEGALLDAIAAAISHADQQGTSQR